MAIERLSIKDALTGSTYFAVNVNGRDYRILTADVLTYIQDNIGTPAFFRQSSAPAATGFNIQVNDASDNVWLIVNPLAGYAAGTITLPAVANCIDGQEVSVICTQSVTTLTIAGNGAVDVIGEPTAVSTYGYFTLRFDATSLIWYRVA